MPKSIIAYVPKGQVMAEAFFERANRECPNSHGVMLANENGLIRLNSDKVFTLEDFVKQQEHTRNCDAFFSFSGDLPKTALHADVNPVSLFKDGDKPTIAAMLEGSGYEMPADQKDSNHIPEHFVLERVKSLIEVILDTQDGDVEKTFAILEKDSSIKNLRNILGARGTLVLMSNKGDKIWIEKNDLGHSFPWGQTSHALGLNLDTSEKEVEEKKDENMDELSRLMSGAHEEVKEENKVAQIADTKSLNDKPPVVERVQCPASVGKKHRRQWYKDKANWIPNNAEHMPLVEVRIPEAAQEKVKTFSDLKNTVAGAAVLAKQPASAGEEKKVEVKPAESKDAGGTRLTDDEYMKMPLVKPEDKEMFLAMLDDKDNKVLLDKSSKSIQDPKYLDEMVKKYPDFAESVGIEGLSLTYGIPYEMYSMMIELAPTAASVLLHNYRCTILQLNRQVHDLRQKYEKKEETTEKKEETVVNQGSPDLDKMTPMEKLRAQKAAAAAARKSA